MARAYIHGVGTAAGAYLARLLLARGYAVDGSDPGGGRLEALGIAEQVGNGSATDADEIYVFDGTAFAALAATRAQLCFASDPRSAAAARAAGRFAASAQLSDNDSRLSDAETPAMRIIAAVHAAGRDGTAVVLDAPEHVRDWGWTPEYVDAMWRMLQQPSPADYVVATGALLSEAEFAVHAAEYFGIELALVAPASAGEAIADPSAALRDLGWRAYTHGRDLVRTLCEGFAATA